MAYFPMSPRRAAWAICFAVWCGTVGLGWFNLTAYENEPGAAAYARSHWPQDSAIERFNDRAALVVFAHPRCPCMRATLEELAAIRSSVGQSLTAVIVFSAQGCSQPFTNDIVDAAHRIPGVRVRWDTTGDEARCFGAATSGQTFLYDRSGELRFEGGITAARGHAGDNAGRDAIIAVLQGSQPDRNRTFVFGCKLTEDALR